MELDSQLMIENNIMFSEAMFYDILSQTNYPIIHYKSPESDEMNLLNNNMSKSDLDAINQSMEHMIKIPLGMIPPPPPHKIVNYNGGNNNNNNVSKQYRQTRDSNRPGDHYRPISPRGCDSDESCASYSSRGAASDSGVRYSSTRCGKLGEQAVIFGNKFSHSSPNVYASQYHQNPHGHYNKNRYYASQQQHQHMVVSPQHHHQQNNNNQHQQHQQHAQAQQQRQTNNRANNHHHSNHHPHHHHHPATNNGHTYRDKSDVMLRRAHGLVERFRSRAELMRIDPCPPRLLDGSPWDQLSQAVWDIFASKAQNEKTYETKIALWKNIFLYIRKYLNNYGLFMVGSTMSGFGLENSDIDMCLLTKPLIHDPRIDSLQHLNSIKTLLIKYGLSVDPEVIMAKVPILKFKDKETGFEIDLNCNNAVGIRNTHLLHCYARSDWRVRPLVVAVKLWAQSNAINDAKNMTVSSYSWALMVIHFLQCGVTPPVLPCLHGLMPEKFNSEVENHTMDVQEEIASTRNFTSENTMSLGELLTGFLQYYSDFNYNEFAISVRAGCRLPIDDCRFQKAPKNDPHQWKYLCIEEPFDFTNTARSVYDLDTFR
ncbi:unnamed protein product [Callosobruchus maculatus]|uniref:Uncharacterized protein n=3 Tax=Callosobruchus maculatus TaxID=64391 RepID=A0A653CUX9_CALMS|nr:unnamed protein product [Callosobruchus maculatus]